MKSGKSEKKKGKEEKNITVPETAGSLNQPGSIWRKVFGYFLQTVSNGDALVESQCILTNLLHKDNPLHTGDVDNNRLYDDTVSSANWPDVTRHTWKEKLTRAVRAESDPAAGYSFKRKIKNVSSLYRYFQGPGQLAPFQRVSPFARTFRVAHFLASWKTPKTKRKSLKMIGRGDWHDTSSHGDHGRPSTAVCQWCMLLAPVTLVSS